MSSKLTLNDIVNTAKAINVEPCALKAVCDVESNGDGFESSGKPKILFEGHIFWRQLKGAGLNPALLAAQHPTLIYPKWTKRFYKGGEAEHERLKQAMAIHREAALKSASWGAFQLMGFNHKLCGYINLDDFVAAMGRDAPTQLAAFISFIKSNYLIKPLQAKNWAAFARGYNGEAYAENEYDKKMARAYAACLTSLK